MEYKLTHMSALCNIWITEMKVYKSHDIASVFVTKTRLIKSKNFQSLSAGVKSVNNLPAYER